MLQKSSDKNNSGGFDFTGNMTRLVEDIIITLPVFSHISTKNILVAISPSNGSKNGVVAKLRPMRFEGGARSKTVRGIEFIAPEININSNHILYIVYFHLPRFLNHGDHKNKVSTVMHELYHISPMFNGDVRRLAGKNYAHGNSRKSYERLIDIYTDEYIKSTKHPELSTFLKYKYSELKHKTGAIFGDMIRIPRSKPVNTNRNIKP